MSATSSDRKHFASAARKGVAFSYAAQMGKLIVLVAYQIAMARLLVPEQFGIVAMASPIFAFGVLVSDLGLSQAAIQRESVTSEQLTLLFWTNVAVTLVLAMLLILSSQSVADFYREPAVAPVLSVMGATLVISGLGSQHLMVLNRELRFATLGLIDFGSLLAGALIGVGAAIWGLGLWALVVQQVATTTVMTVSLWLMVRWRPSRPARAADARALLGFGADVTVANVANYVARNIDNVLIGRVWGDAPLGLYDRAYKLLLLPLSQITTPMGKVAVPLLSRTLKDDAAYRRAYFVMLQLVLILTFPGALFALIARNEVILLLLGPRWSGVAPIFGVLAIGALFAPIGVSMTWLMISQRRTRELRNYGVISSIGFVVGIICGLQWGPVGVATGYIAFGVIQGPVVWRLVTRSGPVESGAFWSALLPFVLACLPVVGVVLGLKQLLASGWVALFVMFTLSYATFLLALLAQRKARENLLYLFRHFSQLIAIAGLSSQPSSVPLGDG